MFNESVLCGENKSKTSGGVTAPLQPAWLLCLLSRGWQVNSLSLEHSSSPREPCRLCSKEHRLAPFTELLSLDPPSLADSSVSEVPAQGNGRRHQSAGIREETIHP